MDQRYDVIVIGAGPGGEVCAAPLGNAGKRVAIVESELVGGECAFWACIPSKVLLRSEEPYFASRRVPGSKAAITGSPSFAQAAAWRSESVSRYDDSEHLPFLRDNHVELIRGEARVEEPSSVRVGDRTYRCDIIVIATGSIPHFPDIDGLRDGRCWTSRDATAAERIPKRLTILGAGAVGVELGQAFARYGSAVTLLEPSEHILAHEEPEVAKLMSDALAADGIRVVAGKAPQKVEWRNGAPAVILEGGQRFESDQLLVATGRTARVHDVNAAALGVKLGNNRAIDVDNQCRAAENVYAIGDVNGIAMFTHVAKYQGRVAADAILGKKTAARYDAVPRCTFTDPEISSTGITESQAREQQRNYVAGQVELSSAARANVYYEQPAAGLIKLVADKTTHALLGASIVGPQASEMIGIATAAIYNRQSVDDLLQVIQPFPTLSEAFYYALEAIKWE